ncbi:hypothetical protein D3C80_2223770 [compost metagenome]
MTLGLGIEPINRPSPAATFIEQSLGNELVAKTPVFFLRDSKILKLSSPIDPVPE